MSNMNNFYCFFPEGLYRTELYRAVGDAELDRAIQSIDLIIEESDFDLDEFLRLMMNKRAANNHYQRHESKRVAAELGGNKELADIHSRRGISFLNIGSRLYHEIQDMIEPIFEEMLAKGYSEEFLTG